MPIKLCAAKRLILSSKFTGYPLLRKSVIKRLRKKGDSPQVLIALVRFDAHSRGQCTAGAYEQGNNGPVLMVATRCQYIWST
jgi:hypothetical protein